MLPHTAHCTDVAANGMIRGMTVPIIRLPAAILAVSAVRDGPPLELDSAKHTLGAADERRVAGDRLRMLLHDLQEVQENSDGRGVAVLSKEPREHETDLRLSEVSALVSTSDSNSTSGVLPPFAAMAWDGSAGSLHAITDALGFRHLYSRSADSWAALSTSARALAALAPAGLDLTAIAVQSLLGWQVGLRTPFAEVSKVAPGARLHLSGGQVTSEKPDAIQPAPGPRGGIDQVVREAARLLCTYLASYLDDHPDAVLQLTGGQDSRILLAAIPPHRRRGFSVMTLSVPGSPDLSIARALAERYSMKHHVIDTSGLEGLAAPEAHDMVVAAARRVDCSADPLALAAVYWAEAKFDQRPRLGGLGGEVARGFYYLGPAGKGTVTKSRVERLAEWRMFTNGAVPLDSLDSGFAKWSRSVAVDVLHSIFNSYGPDWLTATDEFYLNQRMHRWAGVLATANCMDRTIVHPMLDDRFIALARSLSPKEKRNSLFLSRLCCALDEEISEIPLDSRPSPQVYARPNLRNKALLSAMAARRAAGKVHQRIVRRQRPSAGSEILAAKIGQYYVEDSSCLERIARQGILDEQWLDLVSTGHVAVDPASVAMLVNLEVATTGL
jgi:asparagine synthase (glutamine-hydrolysing)